MSDAEQLAAGVLAGDQRALARAITRLENRTGDYRELASRLHTHGGDGRVIGVTGSPGAGKSTLVDELTAQYREADLTVGVIGIDPASPFSGGSILGDRVRMRSAIGDPGVFVRSMSTRGSLGGLSPATGDVIAAYDAFGKDRIIVETVGAGQNEVDIVRLADTVSVVLQPRSGDDVQMLKAGILEIGDIFVVNKADMRGVDRTVSELHEMLELGHDRESEEGWFPPIVETVATEGSGIAEFATNVDEHFEWLASSDRLANARRERYGAELRRILRGELADLVETRIDQHGGIEDLADQIATRERDPYAIAEELVGSIRGRSENTPGR